MLTVFVFIVLSMIKKSMHVFSGETDLHIMLTWIFFSSFFFTNK